MALPDVQCIFSISVTHQDRSLWVPGNRRL